MDNSIYPTADTNFTNAYSLLFKASHVGAGVSVAGLLLNLTLLSVIVANWTTLIKRGSNIGIAILVMVIVSILHGSLMLAMDELWVENIKTEYYHNVTGFLDTPDVGNTLSSASYFLLTVLFAANLLLSLERHWVIRYDGVGLSRVAVGCVFGSAVVFSCFFFAAFAISYDGVSWTFLPLGKPCTWDYDIGLCTMTTAQAVLFMLGMSYFLIVSLVICGIYENSYFLIATVFDTEEDPEYDVVTGKRLVHENVKVQRVALVRCILMSIGLVIFYIPSIILMFVTAFNHDLLYTISINQTLLFCITLIPAFDPLWSPIMILLFQQEFKEAFVEAFKSLWRRCWPSSSQKQVL